MTRPGVRIKDVAEAAGVAISTVSDALNGKGRIGRSTREHVHRVARELGYRPSSLGRGLRTGRSRIVGIVVTKYGQTAWSFVEWPYFTRIIDAAMTVALERGYALTVLPADLEADKIISFPLDGLLVLDPMDGDPIVEAASRRGLHVVADRANSASDAPWVDIDHASAIAEMCARLRADGEAREAPVLVTSDGADSYTARCVAAYVTWCEDSGLAAEVLRCPRDLAGAAQVVRRRLSHDPPRAMFGLEDHHAQILADEAVRAGLDDGPGRMELGCFTELAETPAGWPSMARLTVNPSSMGARGMTLLIDAVEGRPMQPQYRVVPAGLVR